MIYIGGFMSFSTMNDSAILSELGIRIKRQRLNQDITQLELAKRAGISRTAIQRIEQGEECTLKIFIRILRALSILEQLDIFIPDPGYSPIQLAKLQGKVRQRASGTHKKTKYEIS